MWIIIEFERRIKPVDEFVVITHTMDKGGHVMVRIERVFPGERFVEVVAPIAAAAAERVLINELASIFGSRHHEALEA